jgi:predicted Zn-dependent peptidase
VAADVLSDIFLNSVYLPEDIEKERWIILQEIKMQEDSPEEYIHDLFQRVFWKDHGKCNAGYKRSGASQGRDQEKWR